MIENANLNEAIELVLAGEKTQAQSILEAYTSANPHDITAWLWKARTLSTWGARINVLETCLTYNPEDSRILTVLAALNTQHRHNDSQKYSTKNHYGSTPA